MKIYISLLVTTVLALSFLVTPTVFAADGLTCTILPQGICDAATAPAGSDGNVSGTGTYILLRWAINILTAIIGVVAVGVLVYAGILYASAGDNSQQISSAKDMITNTIIGMVAYGLVYFGLNWLIPGGVIG